MSAEAAKAFDISQNDLQKFMGLDRIPSPIPIAPTVEVSNHARYVIFVVSIFLFIVAIFTCGCTLCLWMVSKRKKQDQESNKGEKANLACNEESMNGSMNSSPALPQISERPKLPPKNEISDTEAFDEEELQKLKVTNLDISSSYYVNRDRLQVNVRRVILSDINEVLAQNAYIYLIVSLLPEKKAFYESELRPIAEENYFEEASEFDVLGSELSSRPLVVSIYACDRFSQHKLVNEYTYELGVNLPTEDETKPSIISVSMKEIKRSADSTVIAKDDLFGEVLFSLCYMPTSGRLTFVALKGRNIHDAKETPLATYLRVSLVISGKAMKTVQTSSVRRSTAPIYNEAFVFHTPLERIKDTDVTISVMTYAHNESSPKLIGKVFVGPKSNNNLGRKHWEAMLTSPRKPVAQWHSLDEVL